MIGNAANLRWFYIIDDLLVSESDEILRMQMRKCQDSLQRYPLVIQDLQHCSLLRHFEDEILRKMKARITIEESFLKVDNEESINEERNSPDKDDNRENLIAIAKRFEDEEKRKREKQEAKDMALAMQLSRGVSSSSNFDHYAKPSEDDDLKLAMQLSRVSSSPPNFDHFSKPSEDNDLKYAMQLSQDTYTPPNFDYYAKPSENKDLKLTMRLTQNYFPPPNFDPYAKPSEDQDLELAMQLSQDFSSSPNSDYCAKPSDAFNMDYSTTSKKDNVKSESFVSDERESNKSPAKNRRWFEESDEELYDERLIHKRFKAEESPKGDKKSSSKTNLSLFSKDPIFSRHMNDDSDNEDRTGTKKNTVKPSTSKSKSNDSKKNNKKGIFAQDPIFSRLMVDSSGENESKPAASKNSAQRLKNTSPQKFEKAHAISDNSDEEIPDFDQPSTSRNNQSKPKSPEKALFSQDPIFRRHMNDDSDENETTSGSKKASKNSSRKRNKSSSSSGPKSPPKYYPKPRSGGYAILIALLEAESKSDYVGYMTKKELCKAAQPNCDESMTYTRPGATQYYNGYSSAGLLTKKELIVSWSNPKKIKLTESGRELAIEIMQRKHAAQERYNATFGDDDSWLGQVEMPSTSNMASSSSSSNDFLMDRLPSHFNVRPREPLKEISRRFEEGQTLMIAGSYKIILIVDMMEVAGGTFGGKKSRKNITPETLSELGVDYEIRKLSVGDFIWIARDSENQELVLPFIIERKRMDDLRASIMDGRYKEQKQRIQHSGIPNKIYLVEEIGNYNDVTSNPKGITNKALDRNALEQAMSNTFVRDGFNVKLTKSQRDSMRFLAGMTKKIRKKYRYKNLKNGTLRNANEENLLLFDEFSENSRYDKKLSLREVFCNMLICQRGLSAGMAWGITGKYPTPRCLKTAYENCDNESEKEKLVAGIPYDNGTKKIPLTVSKTLCYLFNDVELH